MVNLICTDALQGLKSLPSESVDMCLTSPPYWKLKDYGVDGQLGQERTLFDYVDNLTEIFQEVFRVLKPTGTLWLNIGDTYAGDSDGYPKKTLLLIPHRVAIALCNRDWILRNEIIWHKPNPVPSSVTDRFTVDHETLFLFSKQKKYYFNQLREPAMSTDKAGKKSKQNLKFWVPSDDHTRQMRTVWNNIKPGPYLSGHPAPFPEALAERVLLAGSNEGDTVLDCFMGSGTTAVVAKRLGRHCVGIDLHPGYLASAFQRLTKDREKQMAVAPSSQGPAR